MGNSKSKKPVFKAYNPDQLSLLPPSLEELIPENHVVRIVRKVVDQINIDSLLSKYEGGGCSSYHPKMLLKVIIYAYISNIYSSRKIESSVQRDIHFMWLSGMQRPDHNTINRFRTNKLKGVLKEVFGQVVLLMVDAGVVNIKRVFVDGTKIEANANKYTFVWGKSIVRNKQRIKDQLQELWDYAQGVAAEELQDNNPTTYEEIDSEKVSKTIASINQALSNKPVEKKVKQKLNYAKRTWPKALDKYKAQEQKMGDRNSYSKTDEDATFMRMKEDHMRNGQLKAGYNWQISTSDQFILNYDIYQNPTDTLTLPKHIESFKELYQTYPEVLVADAGYGSEENYELLDKLKIEGYVKYNYFHKEQKKKYKDNPFLVANLFYNKEKDFYVCPMGQRMEKIGSSKRKTKSGFEQNYSVYQAKNCEGCPMRSLCHKSKSDRRLSVNHNLQKHKSVMRQRLKTEQGLKHRSQRPADVEAVFGNIKHNKNFKRFYLRGKEKVAIEVGLLAIAHNLAKMAN